MDGRRGSTPKRLLLISVVAVAPALHARVAAAGCDEGCDRALPRLIVESGVFVRRFTSLLSGQAGTVMQHGELVRFRVASATPAGRPLDTAVVSTVRAGIALPLGLYAFLEADLGGIAQPAPSTIEMTSAGASNPELSQRYGFIGESLGVVGVRGSTRAGRLGIELAGGVRAVQYSFHSDCRDCAQLPSLLALGPVAELRARGELWLGPWLTGGAIAGASVLERGAWMAGLYVGVHGLPFGGDP